MARGTPGILVVVLGYLAAAVSSSRCLSGWSMSSTSGKGEICPERLEQNYALSAWSKTMPRPVLLPRTGRCNSPGWRAGRIFERVPMRNLVVLPDLKRNKASAREKPDCVLLQATFATRGNLEMRTGARPKTTAAPHPSTRIWHLSTRATSMSLRMACVLRAIAGSEEPTSQPTGSGGETMAICNP
jgi:hypothetical protein